MDLKVLCFLAISVSASCAFFIPSINDQSDTDVDVSTIEKERINIDQLMSNIVGNNELTQLLSFDLHNNLSITLKNIDFSKIVTPVPLIPAPQDINQMPVLPGLRENIMYARKLVALALDRQEDLQGAIQNATNRAIHSLDPLGALSTVCYTIMRIYYNIALQCPLYTVTTAVIVDGLRMIGDVIKSVLIVAASDLAKLG